MKRTILVFSIAALLIVGGITTSLAQEQPVPKKDTVNMDTDAKPEFYYAIEDEESMTDSNRKVSTTVVIVIGAVVVAGVASFFLRRKKK